MDSTLGINNGIERIFDYDNIAIVVLMVCLILSFLMNYYLIKGILKMKDVFYDLSLSINTLNERIGH